MKKAKSVLSFMLIFSLVVGLAPFPSAGMAVKVKAEEAGANETEGDELENFRYEEDASGKVSITAYTGNAVELDLAEIFAGKTVVKIGGYHTGNDNTGPWEGAFEGNTTLVSITIPKTVTAIGTNAFYQAGALTNVIFEDVEESELKTIYQGAFANTSLKSITIPASVESLGAESEYTPKKYGTFFECKNLSEVIFLEDDANKPLGLSSIASDFNLRYGDFSRCISLKKLEFPDRVTSIPPFECYGDSGLYEVILPEHLETIGAHAFDGCAITDIAFPETLREIANDAFRESKLTKVELPDSLHTIGDDVFASTEITQVKFPAGLKVISDRAFTSTKLTQIELPEALESIGDGAFSNTKISKIKFNDALRSIGSTAFASTNVTELEFPEGLDTIDGLAFSGCTALSSTTFYGDTSISSNTFKNCSNNIIYAYKDRSTKIKNTCDTSGYTFNYLAKSLTVDAPSTSKTKYSYGNTFESAGLSLEAKVLNADGTTEDYTVKDPSVCKYEGYNANLAGPQTITVAYGKATDTYSVSVRYDLSKASVSTSGQSYTYTGEAIIPETVVVCNQITVPSAYYKVTGENNINVGTAEYTVSAADEDYTTGSKTGGSFVIEKKKLTDSDISVVIDPESLAYTGKECIPEINVYYTNVNGTLITLKENTDYTIQYQDANNGSNLIDLGSITVTIVGMGNYTGTIAASYDIIEGSQPTPSAPGQTETPQPTPSAPGQTETPQPTSSAPGQTETPQPTSSAPAQTETPQKTPSSQGNDKETAPQKQTIKLKVTSKKLKASKLKKKAVSFSIQASAPGKVSCKKISGSKNLTISIAGKVKVKKGTKKGTYKIKVKITAQKKGNYKKTSMTKLIKVIVK